MSAQFDDTDQARDDNASQATPPLVIMPACVSVHGQNDEQMLVTISQFVMNSDSGMITHNPNGVVLEMKDFSQLMWHLNSIETNLSKQPPRRPHRRSWN
jgi:hypothetical protein